MARTNREAESSVLKTVGNYHWLTMSEKALKCQRRGTAERHPRQFHFYGRLAQLVRAPRLHRGGWGLESLAVYHGTVARLVRRHPHKVIHSGSNPLGTSTLLGCRIKVITCGFEPQDSRSIRLIPAM